MRQAKYMNVDVIAHLEERMKRNTLHYQSDFEIDKDIIQRAARSERQEDKILLWMSRPAGTHCHTEYETFIQGSAANHTWQYFANQENASILACAVEITGTKNGVIIGNVYDLDYHALSSEISKKSVPPSEVEKIFEDGYVVRVPLERSSYAYYAGLVETHGPIEGSRTLPQDKAALSLVLSEQKRSRNKLPDMTKKRSVDEIVDDAKKSATSERPGPGPREQRPLER